jgi:hypothetical protein
MQPIWSIRLVSYQSALNPVVFFGGGNRKTLPVKVVSVSNGISTLEITSKFSNFADNQLMQKLDDGSFGAFNGVKAIYFKN